MNNIARAAAALLAAADAAGDIEPLSDDWEDLSAAVAYDIQDQLIALRVARGERIVGAKLGLTSKAKQEQMGVEEPVFGWLLDSGEMRAGDELDVAVLIHPKCEPEVVFHISEDLAGPGVTARDVLDATAAVGGGLEIIDSRYRNFRFTLPDVIADNTSASKFLLGTDRVEPGVIDLAQLRCTLSVDGEQVAAARGAALLGDPALAVAHLANHLGGRGGRIEAGWVVLAGAMTDAVALRSESVVAAHYDGVGTVELACK